MSERGATLVRAPVERRADPVLAALSLCEREVVGFIRQPSRVIGAIGTSLVFWLLIGLGMGRSFRGGESIAGQTFLEYFYPGMVVLTVLFAAIYSTISIIEDRQTGFLQSVLVAPLPRVSLVAGKVLGGTVLASGQGLVLLPLALLAGIHAPVGNWALAAAMLVLVSLGLSSLGFIFAWKIDSVQGFHGVMNLILMPMWLLSGAFFPAGGAHGVLRAIMYANPLTYGMAAFRHALYFDDAVVRGGLPALWICLAVLGGFTALMVLGAQRAVVKKGRS